MRSIVVWIMFALVCSGARAEWRVDVGWDPLTDKREAMAYTEDDKGNRLFFYRADDGSIRATVNLVKTGYLPTRVDDKAAPIYRVDRAAPVDLGTQREALAVRYDGPTFGWRVSDNAAWPSKGPLASLVAGKRILLRIGVVEVGEDASKPTDFVFDLDGAERAVRLMVELLTAPTDK